VTASKEFGFVAVLSEGSDCGVDRVGADIIE
jgi:hypothetical protein